MSPIVLVNADPLAELLHELHVGCDWKPDDPADVGMGSHHAGDHDRDAKRLRKALGVSANFRDEAGYIHEVPV